MIVSVSSVLFFFGTPFQRPYEVCTLQEALSYLK